MALRNGLSVIAADFDQTEAIQHEFKQRMGYPPNLVHIALAGHEGYRETHTHRFAGVYVPHVRYHGGAFNAIMTGENSEHNRRLIYHATAINLGSGSTTRFRDELWREGLGRALLERVYDGRPLAIMTQSAGTVYAGEEDVDLEWWDNGRVGLNYSRGLGILPNTNLMVHLDDWNRHTWDCLRQMGHDIPGRVGFGTDKYTALLFEGDSVRKIGGQDRKIFIGREGGVWEFY